MNKGNGYYEAHTPGELLVADVQIWVRLQQHGQRTRTTRQIKYMANTTPEIYQRARSDRRLFVVVVALGEVPRREEGAGHGREDGDLLPLGRLICEERSNA